MQIILMEVFIRFLKKHFIFLIYHLRQLTKYFKIPYNNQKFNLVYDDALHFIKQNNKQYSVIIVDLFKDIEVPEEFLQKTFFESLLKCKTKNGVIFFNFIENKNNESLHSLRNKFSELKITSEVFTQKLYGTTNYVLKLY
ncbi:MAG: hypothetical protein HYU68_09340 [Bacteroidetes bacterium]|nr:hypothetical protein [Bacteroidota bacterium]